MHNDNMPAIAAAITTRVANFDAWKDAFEAHTDVRRQAGILGHHISRGADDPSLVCVLLAASSRAGLERYLASDELKARERDAGVAGSASVALLVPQEDRASRGRPLAAAMVSFDVEDYDRWKASFDAGREHRQRMGIVGHAVNRAAANPGEVVVYLQAETTAQLRALLDSPALRAGMQQAGASSPTRISWLQDPGYWAQYPS